MRNENKLVQKKIQKISKRRKKNSFLSCFLHKFFFACYIKQIIIVRRKSFGKEQYLQFLPVNGEKGKYIE